jgi:hypothetical protein
VGAFVGLKTASISRERAQREKPRGQKADLYKWVNDQQQLDMRTKYILKELADFAEADCCAWSKVATLAYAANCRNARCSTTCGRWRPAA